MAQERLDFGEFYASNRDACLRAVIATVGDPRLAEDLVAEAFARAWSSWTKVSRHPAPRAWVVRTALNTRVSWWRKRRREIALADYDAAAPDEGGGLDQTVIAAIRRLPSRQREVIVLRVLLDLDTETTARELGIAPGTVMTHLSRAVTALRRDLSASHTNHAPVEASP